MSEILQDKSLGLVLKGYNLIPNGSLATKIGIYTPLIIETLLQEHPEEVDKWLQKLHTESIRQKSYAYSKMILLHALILKFMNISKRASRVGKKGV